jgi:hypothetical protein
MKKFTNQGRELQAEKKMKVFNFLLYVYYVHFVMCKPSALLLGGEHAITNHGGTGRNARNLF